MTSARFITEIDGTAPSTGYSHVSWATGRLVTVAGQLAIGPDGTTVGVADPGRQARQVFANLRAALEKAGATFADVIKFTIYVTDMAVLPEYRAARAEHFPADAPLPASTAVQVVALAGPDFLLEVEAIAVVDDEAA